MKKNLIIGCIISILVLSLCEINYRNTYTSSLTCKMGRLQSPIDLKDQFSKFNATIYPVYYHYSVIPNAYLGWSDDGGLAELRRVNQNQSDINYGYLGLQRDGILKQYELTDIEVNFPGEHMIEGKSFQVEVKFLHKKVLGFQTNVNQYRRIPDANTYLYISILYRTDGTSSDNGFLDELVSSWTGPERTGAFGTYTQTGPYSLDLLSYGLFQDRQFYFYEGSYTYEPCDETVNQMVIKDTFSVSADAMKVLANIYSKYTNAVASKSISEYYGRPIYRNYMNATEASSSFITLNLALILALFFLLL